MFEKLKHNLILNNSATKLHLLAVITGLVASAVIIALRLLIEHGHALLSPAEKPFSFADLDWQWVLTFPIVGGVLIGVIMTRLSPHDRQTGIVHVIERLSTHEGRLPIKNALFQFFGAAIALITGHSVGREGPSVHLGAASGSLIATSIELTNTHLRILLACGVAAGISASFDTPVAGVIFAIEVVMMEYHIASFIPVILASVTGAILSRVVLGDENSLFLSLDAEMKSLWEIPYIILMGVVIGVIATLFIRCLRLFTGFAANKPIWLTTSLAGLLVGVGGVLMPEVMGLSYGIIETLTITNISLFTIVSLLILKLILSTACIGLGIPGGLIGPLLIVGACAGAAMGYIGNLFLPEMSSLLHFYIMIGMCAMMAAVLNAPLAALMALLEMTGNPSIILPGMLAIVFSCLINYDLFKQDALFISLLKAKGIDYKNDPITQTLRRINVADAMNKNISVVANIINREDALMALKNSPDWLLIQQKHQPMAMMPAVDLVRVLEDEEMQTLDLMNIPASRKEVKRISLNSSLAEAIQTIERNHIEVLYVSRFIAPAVEQSYGIISKEMIESHYQRPIT